MPAALTTDGLRRSFNMRVPMRDGVELSVDITFPETLPAPGVLVLTPYGKSSERAANVAAAYATGGYVFVAADVRGRGDSDGGPFVPYRHDGEDGAALIAWMAAQDWCSGEVATWGGSYAGRVQWLIALERPPALKAMVVQVCPSDPHVEWPTGTQTLMMIHWHAATDGRAGQVRPHVDWDAVLRHLPLVDLDEAAGFHSESWRAALAHSTIDDYWAGISYQERIQELDLPVMHISGWYDDEAVGTPRNFNAMRATARSDRARDGQRMVMGPWGHAVNTTQELSGIDFGAEALIDLRGRELAFLDAQLRDAADDTAPVRIFVMGVNEWRDEPSWPPEYVREVSYHLHGQGSGETGRLAVETPAARLPPDTWRHDPFDPVPFIMPPSAAQLGGPDDYREVEERPDVLVFSTPTLTEDVEVVGPVRLRAFVATSADDADLIARLVDVHPDGLAQRLCDGIVRLRYRDGMHEAVKVLPGETYEVEVDMWDTAHRFLAGHAIRLEVMSSAFPKYDRNLGTGGDMVTETEGVVATNTLFHDAERPSRLLLQVSQPR